MVILAIFILPESACSQVKPIPILHAHNDYWHHKPLLLSLRNGVTSIEVDVCAVYDRLVVTHNHKRLAKKQDIEELYIEPLIEIIDENGGMVYKGYPDQKLILYIDNKCDLTLTCDLVEGIAIKYPDYFASFDPETETLSDAPVIFMTHCLPSDSSLTYWVKSGRWGDIGSGISTAKMPRVTGSLRGFTDVSFFFGLPKKDHQKVIDKINEVHEDGRKIRLWSAPNRKKMWKFLLDSGADWINVDRLRRFRRWYWRYEN